MTRSYPVRITQMSDMEKMNRIIDLENALQQTNDRIATAVQAEREAVAKALPLTIKTAIETEREACAMLADDMESRSAIRADHAKGDTKQQRIAQGDMAQRIAAAIRARSTAAEPVALFDDKAMSDEDADMLEAEQEFEAAEFFGIKPAKPKRSRARNGAGRK